MASDFNFLQQISQSFSSGPSYSSVSRSAGSKSPQRIAGYGSASLSDSDFEKILRKSTLGAGSSIQWNSYGNRPAQGDEDGFRADLNGDEGIESVAHAQNLMGGVSHLQHESQEALGDQGLYAQRIELLQLLKQLGVEFLTSAESGNPVSSTAAVENAALIHAKGDEAILNSAVRQMDAAKLEALLKQFQTGDQAVLNSAFRQKDVAKPEALLKQFQTGDQAALNSAVRQMDVAKPEALLKQFQTGDQAVLNSAVRQMDVAKPEALLKQFQTGADGKTTAELQRIIDAFKGIALDDAAGDTKSGGIVKSEPYTAAKPDAASIVGDSQHDNLQSNTSGLINKDKAARAEVARNPASIKPLLDTGSDQIMSDPRKNPQAAQGSAEDKLPGERVSPQAVLKGDNSADHLNPQSLPNASGQEQHNARGIPLKEGAGSATNQTDATLFSNLSAIKAHHDSPFFKPAILTSDATSTAEIGNKIMNSDAAKDEGFLFSQHPNELKTSESHTLAKEAETGSKDIRSQTLDQIVQKAVLHLKNGRNEIQINLKPDFLGNLRMQVITESQQVTVRILAEFPMVKDLIENNIQQLKSDLQNCGLQIDELEVSVEHGSDQQVADQQKASGTNTANSAENSPADEDTESENNAASRPGSLTRNENATIDFFA